jgi:CSLREA domain-containing protein
VAGPAQAATFVVNNVGDAGDAAPGNGVCATAGAVCTLRAAIQEANALAGADTINFNIAPAGAKTIAPGSILPGITSVVTINGTTQPGFVAAPPFAPVIELNGAAAGVTGLLLDVGSSGSTIRGLCINRTVGAAIRITGSSNNIISGNFLGTNLAGSAPGPGNQVGVFVGFSGVTNDNRIGGTVAADRNIISGNTVDGIQIFNGGGTAANNLVQGNYIGLDVNGTLDVGNSNQGVSIFGGTDNNTVGGTVAGARNVISGNNNDGVLIADAGTTGNIVQGNRIGTNAAGTAAVANLRGIELASSASSAIGGAVAGAGNLISGNLAGITINASNNNTIEGNRIGTDVSGTLDLGNLQHGVEVIAGASNNVIGGAAGAGNVISGNDQYGVNVIGAGTSNNRVVGNIIGLDLNGDADLGNTQMGVSVGQGATANIVGEAGNRNVISGNDQHGVFLTDAGTNNNRVQNNYIGLDITGTLARPNGIDGVRLDAGGAATGNIIGGTSAGLGNVISGNVGSGIHVINQMASMLIAGNLVGTSAAGTAAIGNGQHGVEISAGSAGNTVGGPSAAERNVLSGNAGQGVRIDGPSTNNNVVAGNRIGTNAAGTAGIGNASGGIAITNSAANNTIGGPIGGNLIAFNTGGDGVNVAAGAGTGNGILGNSIHTNTGLGIDLLNNGVTSNDLGDGDSGPNNLQNFPALSGAMSVGGNVHVAGSLNSAASTTYRIEFFANSVAIVDEGERFLGAVSVGTDTNGNVAFGATFVASVSPGEFITATATDPANNTSELSAPLAVVGYLLVTTTADTIGGTTTSVANLVGAPGPDGRISLREAILATNATSGTDTIGFGIPLADAGHLYYQNDAIAASLTNVQPTALADTATPSSPAISNFDPDYPPGLTRSWYRIQPGSAYPITDATTLNGTTQPGYIVGGPVIEVDGVSGGTGTLDLQAGSSGSTIRGLAINRTPGAGIRIQASSNNIIAGNFLGTNLAGTAALANNVGIYIGAGTGVANNNVVGGTVAADRNVISGNAIDGIQLDGTSGGGIANNAIQGNYIGLDVNGTADLGNTNQGISEFGTSSNNVIGGTAPGAGNVISGNNGHGIHMHDVGVTGTLVQGNKIGTNAAGTAGIPNNGAGVRLYLSTSNNTVGGTAAGAGNLIAYNGLAGVLLRATAGNGNSILGNTIGSNGGLGIDLNEDGVTANDALDADTGPNSLLNFPLITSAFVSGPTVTVNFKLDVPAGSYRIEFFKNPSGADPSTFGEGEVYVGSSNVTHPGGGALFFNNAFAGVANDVITATTTACTDGAVCAAFGSTSEFAKAMTAVTTAVELLSFTAVGRDQAVDLSWQTASELGNLGFHLYRSRSAGGPYERITPAVIPGLGSSPTGTSYSHRDTGLTNGVVYFYKLEDIETTGATELHGPVSAAPGSGGDDDGDTDPAPSHPGRVAYGDPSAISLKVLERDARHALLELRTAGFYATANADGSVELEIPSFEDHAGPGQPKVPTRRAWVEAVAGRGVLITSVQAQDAVAFPGLRPAPGEAPAIDVTREGMVRPGGLRRRAGASFRRGVFPRSAARLLGTAFQGETKKAELDLAPLRFQTTSGQLVLSRRLLVRVEFVGQQTGETSLGGSHGRRPMLPRLRSAQRPLVQLVVRDKGLYKVRFEDVFPERRAGVSLPSLSLSRRGEPVAFFVDRSSFGPGASLYFLSEGASLNPDSQEAVYELVGKAGGLRMGVSSAAPSGAPTPFYWQHVLQEENKTYQAGLLDASDLWLWQVLVAPVTKAYPLTVDQVASTSAPARLRVWLQGASDYEADPDHHVRVLLNGTYLGEATWDGRTPRTIDVDVTPGVLLEGSNTLEIQNVGDTGAAQSMVLLDKFSLVYPRATTAAAGVLEGSFTESGTAEVPGLGPDAVLLDTTDVTPRWLTGATAGASGMSFRAETGHRYFAAAPSALRTPALRVPAPPTLRSTRNQADYVLVGPRAFLATAEPLLALRQSQGLRTQAVAIEDVYDAFGCGEESPEALKDFLAYAYHSWKRPSLRYVVLLGDATYDPKDYLQTGVRNRVAPLMTRTTYLWTASDPAYAALNGDDLLPDVALGRLPAATIDEARILVEKIIAFETAGRDLSGPAVLVADNADLAGDFEANANDIARSILAGRTVERVFLSEKGAATRAEIAHALDQGASLMSYVGHGGTAVWASENVWNNLDVNALLPQAQQPVLFTMNCLNGFFHFPPLNSLAEQFLKAEGKGAVAAFSPSGLSLDGPAHVLHKALLTELLSGRHERLGDAVLAAQGTYADSGAFPELLTIYHLFGDPAMKVR